jgi:hypothetical protein
MTYAKRLTTIESALTPKGAVLLWLKEAQKLDYLKFAEKVFEGPAWQAPRSRIPKRVAQAVRDSLRKQRAKPELIGKAVREARDQADFLTALIFRLYAEVESARPLHHAYILLLREKFYRLLLEFAQDTVDTKHWNVWRVILLRVLEGMWRLRDVIDETSKQYFNGHPLLFESEAHRLNDDISAIEAMVKDYNSLEKELPSWTAFDLSALASSVAAQVPAAIAEQVAYARAGVLRLRYGDWSAASELEGPYALEMIERLRAENPRKPNLQSH